MRIELNCCRFSTAQWKLNRAGGQYARLSRLCADPHAQPPQACHAYARSRTSAARGEMRQCRRTKQAQRAADVPYDCTRQPYAAHEKTPINPLLETSLETRAEAHAGTALYLRNSPGAFPVYFRKTFAKYWLDENPTEKATSVTEDPGFDKRFRASSTRFL